MTIEARVVCDSIGEHSPRLTTFWTRYPKFIHGEHLRHRTGSYCVSSSRAIPVSKNLQEVRLDELRASPVWWGREQKGMASGEELSAEYDGTTKVWSDPLSRKEEAQKQWQSAALSAAGHAELLTRIGVHKSIVNRLLEPFLHVNVLVTSCEPGLLNFFGLRLDKAAQPEIRVLAEAMWKVWCESTPQKLKPGQWHLPFIDYDDVRTLFGGVSWPDMILDTPERLSLRKVSTGRCARLSYMSFETGRRSTIEENLALYERLVGAHPIHASPAEHQATPDYYLNISKVARPGEHGEVITTDENPPRFKWSQPELHGNLPGWIQHRKLLPGEAQAPLPEGYARG